LNSPGFQKPRFLTVTPNLIGKNVEPNLIGKNVEQASCLFLFGLNLIGKNVEQASCLFLFGLKQAGCLFHKYIL
jgi:hypothetical protein